MRTAVVRQQLDHMAARRSSIPRLAEEAARRRKAIKDDHTYDTGARGRRARDAALREVADEVTASIASELKAIREDADWIEKYELSGERRAWQTPSAEAVTAGERVRAMLDAGVTLPDVLTTAERDGDGPALEYLHRGIGSLVRAEVAKADPRRVATPEVDEHAAAMAERLTDARAPYMGLGEREFHEARRAVAEHLAGGQLDAAYWGRVGRGTATPTDRFAYGLATQPEWVEMLAGAAGTWDEPGGPVEQAGASGA